jgi:hypothetical protein
VADEPYAGAPVVAVEPGIVATPVEPSGKTMLKVESDVAGAPGIAFCVINGGMPVVPCVLTGIAEFAGGAPHVKPGSRPTRTSLSGLNSKPDGAERV